MKTTLKITALVLMITAVASCSKKSDDTTTVTPAANNVVMQGIAFVPATITISKGTTVTWTNKENVTHNVTASDNSFVSGSLNMGNTFQHTFAATGTYSYVCTFHSTMKGTVIVQ